MFAARTTRIVAVAVLAVALAGGSTAAYASAARTPAGGTIHLYVSTGGRSDTVAPVLVAGAIGDVGTATSIDRAGRVDAGGAYIRFTLAKGAFTVNATPFHSHLVKVTPSIDQATCSVYYTASGMATLSAGTGRYKGVRGTARLSETVAAITSRRAGGRCNTVRSAQPISEYAFLTGTGQVRF